MSLNYDTNSFAFFMESKKCKNWNSIVDDGMNIDNWAYEELTEAVIEFRSIQD